MLFLFQIYLGYSENAKSTRCPSKALNDRNKIRSTEKINEGWSVSRVCDHFRVKKQTVSDIKKKSTLQEFAVKYSVASSLESTAVGGLKAVWPTPYESHDEAVMKWYQQMRST